MVKRITRYDTAGSCLRGNGRPVDQGRVRARDRNIWKEIVVDNR